MAHLEAVRLEQTHVVDLVGETLGDLGVVGVCHADKDEQPWPVDATYLVARDINVGAVYSLNYCTHGGRLPCAAPSRRCWQDAHMPAAVELAAIVRSGVQEGTHHGHAVVVDGDGNITRAWGDPDARILPRSANKIAQASAMVRAGLPLTDELLALSAASHSGEPFHLDGVRRILGDIPEGLLQTPPDWPWDEEERCSLRADGLTPASIYMNCSGKHAAMLVTCAINGWPMETYLHAEHPLQRSIAAEIAELAGEEPWARAVDGCGAPLLGLSLAGLARTGSRAATADPTTPERRVADAMRDYPEWVAGTRRDAAALSAGVPGLLLKEGAEGVYVAGLPDGTGIAMKIEDGAGRARQVVMAAILARLGRDEPIVSEQSVISLTGGSERVGEIRATLD